MIRFVQFQLVIHPEDGEVMEIYALDQEGRIWVGEFIQGNELGWRSQPLPAPPAPEEN